mmetsp:Transcript_23632/g.59521  ORF Transcript_23632/g.59521 Transcript_23632/m.59521 type:complete len:93 (-) Transcript_23632:209-487(-)
MRQATQTGKTTQQITTLSNEAKKLYNKLCDIEIIRKREEEANKASDELKRAAKEFFHDLESYLYRRPPPRVQRQMVQVDMAAGVPLCEEPYL